MSIEQQQSISTPETKGLETNCLNIYTNILSSISNIIKLDDEIIDYSNDKDNELPYVDTFRLKCEIRCSSGIRRKIEYWSSWNCEEDYEEHYDNLRDYARSIHRGYTNYKDENNFEQCVLFAGCRRGGVDDLRKRNEKKYSDSNWYWDSSWEFTMCYVLSSKSQLCNRRSGWDDFSNSLVDAYFTNVEYRSEKLEKSIILEIDEGHYLDRNEILSVCYVFRLLRHMDMEKFFDIDYKLVITDYNQKTFEITKNNYILLDGETYTVIDLLNKTEVENDDDDDDDDDTFMMLNSDYDNDDL